MTESNHSGIHALIENARNITSSFLQSFLRGGRPDSDRSRSAVTVNNFFLHIHSAKTHLNTLRPTYTLGLGLISFFLLIITYRKPVFYELYIRTHYHPLKLRTCP